MVSWIALAVIGSVLGAVVALLDKYIVTSPRVMPRPFVYAFYTCLLSGAWVLVYGASLIPMLDIAGVPSISRIEGLTSTIASLSILAAGFFFIALVTMFTALKEADTSDVIPVIGAVSAITSFLLSYAFLGARLTPNFLVGLFLLALGTFLVSHLRFRAKIALYSVYAGVAFGIHYVILKGLFTETTFDNGFFWSRIAFIVVALAVLVVPAYYAQISTQTKATTKKSGALVLFTKALAGIASIFILKATALGDVSIVQALGGLQYVFLLLFAMFVGRRTPIECGENILCNEDIYHKAIFIGIITVGFIVLFV